MGFWNLIAEANAIELLIRVGVVVLFIFGPYLLKFLGGQAVQDDRGNPGRRKREPQSDLEREIAEFLAQSRGGGSPAYAPATSADDEDDDIVPAQTAHESLRDHHLESTLESQAAPPTAPAKPVSTSDQPYHVHESEQANTPEIFSYDESDPKPAGQNAGASIAAMFRDPTQVRNAFILGEIMARPKIPRR
ncbi:hypothetical protein AB1L30_11505 [Bremerella sp. JC817]|uniref:hypothetical protein n=1 Tax=Bremerella sp. JC817 TaxID=3231756 RepID=UPI003457D062